MYGQPMMMQPQPPMMMQPMMMAPPPPPVYYPPPQQQQGPTIITLNQNHGTGSICPVCSHQTGNLPRKKIGCVAITWCFVLAFTTGCCCIPLCMDGCKDTELLCVKCQTVKTKIPANCC